MRPMDAPKIVFILASNYSGSHLLAHLLSAHSRCAGVGELHNYRKFRERGSRSGNVVDDYLAHPAFAGLENVRIADWHRTVFTRLRETQPGLSHLIDNSKRPAWARRFPGHDACHVHLLRDPRALVARWLQTYETPQALRSQRWRVLRQRPWSIGSVSRPVDVYVQKWLLTNQAISRFLAGRGAPVVTYRDLTLCTRDVLNRLMPRFGLSYEDRQLRYGESGNHLGTRKREYQAAAERSLIEIDLRWRDRLSARDRCRIEHHPGVRRYLAAQGLDMTDDGLTGRPGA